MNSLAEPNPWYHLLLFLPTKIIIFGFAVGDDWLCSLRSWLLTMCLWRIKMFFHWRMICNGNMVDASLWWPCLRSVMDMVMSWFSALVWLWNEDVFTVICGYDILVIQFSAYSLANVFICALTSLHIVHKYEMHLKLSNGVHRWPYDAHIKNVLILKLHVWWIL